MLVISQSVKLVKFVKTEKYPSNNSKLRNTPLVPEKIDDFSRSSLLALSSQPFPNTDSYALLSCTNRFPASSFNPHVGSKGHKSRAQSLDELIPDLLVGIASHLSGLCSPHPEE